MAVGLLETSAPRVRAGSGRALHVVHLIEALGPGGAERLLYTNLKHFDPARVRSTVFTVYPRSDHWGGAIRELGVEVIGLGCRGPRDLPRAGLRLRSWLRSERPHLLHTHLWGANVVGRFAGRLSGVPVVSSMHGLDYEPETWNDGSGVSLRKRRLIRLVDRWMARFCSARIVAVSDSVRRSAHRHLRYPLGRMDLLYNPVDVDEFRPPAGGEREEVLGELGLPADSLLLLNVGHVIPAKGLLYAIRALPSVLKGHPAAHLVSVGALNSPEWLALLRGEAESLGVAGHVHILGPRRDVPRLLRACDLFVFPSLHEGLGIALIEAMASGRACVAAESGPLPEVVEHGKSGWLVSPRDAEGLAEAISMLLSDPSLRASLGRAARETTLDRFQPRRAADRLVEIYESVAGAGRN
ncbi:MAG TPA: glycosyltransferase [Pyrinomonadaceae bacterium]|nr:glycosyltransferase [Pyrinomonadaceae bacterium]